MEDLPQSLANSTLRKKTHIRDLFDTAYKKLYGRTYPDNQIEFVTFKVRAGLPPRPFHLPPPTKNGGTLEDCVKGRRRAFSLIQKDFIPFTVYDLFKLFPGARFSGPAIIEERESTIVVGEDARVRVDEHGFVWIYIGLTIED